MYVIELAIKMSPMPVSVQRKEQAAAEALYQQVRQTMEQGQPRLLELSCEKMEGKRVSVLSSEVLSVQIYEKTASGGGSKRPGFAFDGSMAPERSINAASASRALDFGCWWAATAAARAPCSA